MPRPRPPVTATAGRLANFDRLRPYLDPWPAMFPTSADPVIRPLAIGTREALRARIVVPDGMPEAEARRTIDMAVRGYVRSAGYLLAMSQPDSQRHDLDGKVVEPVSDQHRRDAKAAFDDRQRLRAEGKPWPPRKAKPPVAAAVEQPIAELADMSMDVSATDTAVAPAPVRPAPVERAGAFSADAVQPAPAAVEPPSSPPPAPKLGKGGRPILKLKTPVGR